METRLLAFIGVAALLTITPGPDMALVAKVVFGRGRTAGWLTSLGAVSGHLFWGAASALGVAAILNASATLYTILRFAGAAYLIWLGVRSLITHRTSHEETAAPPLASKAGSYRQGLINNLLNPKMGVFYTTLLPQFISPGQPVFLISIFLAAIFATIVAIWLTFYVVMLSRANTFFRRSKVRQAMERITGIVLIGLGIRLAVEKG